MSIQILLGQKVRQLREERQWSQDYLSEVSGLHRTYISGIERGVRNPTITIIEQIANALGVSVDSLLRND